MEAKGVAVVQRRTADGASEGRRLAEARYREGVSHLLHKVTIWFDKAGSKLSRNLILWKFDRFFYSWDTNSNHFSWKYVLFKGIMGILKLV